METYSSLTAGKGLRPFLNITGKSDLIREIAEDFKLKVIDFRASQMDPTDVNGFGMIVNKNTTPVAQYVPFDVFPLEDAKIPKGYTGFLLFFDELSSAPKSVEAALYKVLLDRMIGQRKLHPATAMICAGNLVTSGAIVNRQGTATQSRMAHLTLSVDPVEWIKWATAQDIDLRIISYISSLPEKLHDFDPKHTDKTFASPRTWEFASKVLKVLGQVPLRDHLVNLAGIIGEAGARQFVAFAETLVELPSIQEIKAHPETAELSKKPSLLHATTYLLAAHMKKDTLDALMVYLNRMPMEFQTLCLQNALQRNRDLLAHDLIQDWIMEKGEALL